MSTCYKCGQYVADGGTIRLGGTGPSGLEDIAIWVNVAPHAASGGTMMPFHPRCAPGGEDVYKFVTEADCKRREAAATESLRSQLLASQAALEESVKLQNHYAGLLNQYDGGARMRFWSAQEWLARLAALASGRETSKP